MGFDFDTLNISTPVITPDDIDRLISSLDIQA
jgi:hypothetical protein